jgi:predicted metal-binding membrane protein
MHAASHRSRFLPVMAALSATAWLALWLWGQSPYSRYLDHGGWAEIGVAGSLCRALPGGRDALTGSLVVDGWVLMLSAMMLPTPLPLLDIFRRLTMRRRPAAADGARRRRVSHGLGRVRVCRSPRRLGRRGCGPPVGLVGSPTPG